jgi:hypothetical protein
MADRFLVQSQHRDIQVLGPSQVVDVERVAATTIPHNVYFERNVPLVAWNPSDVGLWLEPIASAIEAFLETGQAVSASFVQDVDDSGLLTDSIEFIVQVPPPSAAQSGPMQTTVVVPLNLLAEPQFSGVLVQPMFDEAIANLRAVASV